MLTNRVPDTLTCPRVTRLVLSFFAKRVEQRPAKECRRQAEPAEGVYASAAWGAAQHAPNSSGGCPCPRQPLARSDASLALFEISRNADGHLRAQTIVTVLPAPSVARALCVLLLAAWPRRSALHTSHPELEATFGQPAVARGQTDRWCGAEESSALLQAAASPGLPALRQTRRCRHRCHHRRPAAVSGHHRRQVRASHTRSPSAAHLHVENECGAGTLMPHGNTAQVASPGCRAPFETCHCCERRPP
jgi:hypothetical protein